MALLIEEAQAAAVLLRRRKHCPLIHGPLLRVRVPLHAMSSWYSAELSAQGGVRPRTSTSCKSSTSTSQSSRRERQAQDPSLSPRASPAHPQLKLRKSVAPWRRKGNLYGGRLGKTASRKIRQQHSPGLLLRAVSLHEPELPHRLRRLSSCASPHRRLRRPRFRGCGLTIAQLFTFGA